MIVNSKLKIIKANEKDIDDLSFALKDLSWKRQPSIYRQYLNEQDVGERVFFIARTENQVAGHVCLVLQSKYSYFIEHSIPEISDLLVFPDFRRQGIGLKLLKYCE